jgi:hypothetical protein
MARQIRRRRPSRSSVPSDGSGRPLWGRPTDEFPDLPVDITAISDNRLMELFAIYTSWWNYAATVKADVENAEAEAESNLRYIQATKLIESWDGNVKESRVTVAKAERDIDPEVVRAEQRVLTAKATRRLDVVVYDNCERCANLVSREVTRRTGGRNLQGRFDRMTP